MFTIQDAFVGENYSNHHTSYNFTVDLALAIFEFILGFQSSEDTDTISLKKYLIFDDNSTLSGHFILEKQSNPCSGPFLILTLVISVLLKLAFLSRRVFRCFFFLALAAHDHITIVALNANPDVPCLVPLM